MLKLKKLTKSKDFIGWKSEDGLLEVVDIYGKQGSITTFKVICHKCKEDKELFPLGYFVSTKKNLEKGQKPCGCSKSPRWNQEQYLILARRAAQDRFIVHGFAEEFHGNKTKLDCECLIDGYKWTPNLNHLVTGDRTGCPKCGGTLKLNELDITTQCKTLCNEINYEFIGFVNGFKGWNSIFNYRCPKHGIQQAVSYYFISVGSRCNLCAIESSRELRRTSEKEALEKCESICNEINYTSVGFIGGYKGAHKTYFEYKCPVHGKQNVRYNNFVHNGARCKDCCNEKRKELNAGFYGYYPERKDEQDYLYVLNFNNKFIKVGRSFDVNERIKKLRTESKIKKIHTIRIFTATHQEIYDLEQELHSELRERNFQYYVKWSKECFENDCLYSLNKLLDNCDLEEVPCN